MACLEELISAAGCEKEVDLLLEGADIVNTLSGEVHREDVAIHQGRVVGFDCKSAREVLDLTGLTLTPGFIDGHVHIESAMVTIPEYARAVVPMGTTTAIIDPHEIANVLGSDGIWYMLESSRDLPLRVYAMLPSCVPATSLETSGAVLDCDSLAELMDHPRVLGLAEVMNYPGVIFRDPEVLKKIRLAGSKKVDGHAPLLSGRDLAAYIIAGIESDHECTTLAEAREKLRLGMHINIREGSAAKNLRDLLPLVQAANSRRFLFVSDDRHPADILREGHIDFMVRTAVREGLDPVIALQIASLNAASYFGLSDLGAIAPGYRADIAVLDDLDRLNVTKVLKDGRVVAENGHLTACTPDAPALKRRTMNLPELDATSFDIAARPGPARVIGIVPDQIVTELLMLVPRTSQGMVVADLYQDILKMAVVERHRASGNIGLGLVRGFGLRSGALATSVCHDSHNLAVVGTSSQEMLAAARAVEEMGGGMAAVGGGRVLARLPLPVAGLLSERCMMEVAERIDDCTDAARKLGCRLRDPFMTLSFLCLPVIPELKLSDRGLVDVGRFDFVPLFCEDDPRA
ncbi:MAG: adenine deaminase [Methanotrichaceae archaeon]|nr:adenine deaminase [Methanotrichaceae archaeon]